jgi:DNA-binding CsgD family transcriptional regulator
MHAHAPAPSILVGRDRELGILRARLAAARTGNGGLVLIGGEAGIGKTTLAEALCREATERGALLLIGRCYDLTETPPYGPWVELFAHYRSGDGTPSPPDAFAERGTIGPVASQGALLQQVLDFAIALTDIRPVVLLLDDLHWADHASLDLLRFLARATTTLPLLLIATYRADALTRGHPLAALLPILVREAPTERIALRRLESADIRALSTARYGLIDPDVDRLVTYLHARSEGNPFFLGELLRSLEEERALWPSTAGWHLGDLGEVGVPALLHQVIDARLDRLDEESQHLLTIAAVIGQEVPVRAWSAVSDATEETLATTMERAIGAHLMETAAGSVAVRFVHALVRETLYERITPIRRGTWHRRVADFLVGASHPDPDAVAYHYRRAEDPRAASWLMRAGERAEASYALLSAADRYDAALALMEASGTGEAERGWLLYHLAHVRRFSDNARALAHLAAAADLAAAAGDRVLAAYVRRNEGLCRCLVGELRTGLPQLLAGVAAVESCLNAKRQQDPAAAPSTAEWTERAQNWSLCTLWLAQTGQFAAVHTAWEAAIATVAQLLPGGIERLPGNPHWGRALAYAQQGQVAEARQALALARRYFSRDETNHNAGAALIHELIVLALPYHADNVAERRRIAAAAERAWTRAGAVQATAPAAYARLPLLGLEGEWDELRRMLRDAPTTREAFAGQTTVASFTIGAFGYVPDDPESGWRLVHMWLPEGPETEPGTAFYLTTVQLQRLAVALAHQGNDLPTMRRWLEAQDRWLAWSGAALGRAEAALGWAAYHRASAEADRASQRASEALRHATEPRQPLALLATHRLLGELATDAGRFADAATHLTQSLTLADACAAPYERALTLLALAEMRIATGDAETARTLLDEVRSICTRLGARPTLDRAAALAARLATMEAVSPAFPAGLSAREVEVLRLLAAGRTNREIADLLFLSENTVRVHVRNILTKTNTDNRTQAAAFARDHGLH